MKSAYVDSSCMVSVAVGEPGHRELMARLSRFDQLFSSNLLEAELRSVLVREGGEGVLRNPWSWFLWVFPYRTLTPEIRSILDFGYLKGADLWHLACALFLSRKVDRLSFLTLDRQQGDIARSLGFRGL
ncbi:MAG TPA: PIN domain-containing protein [Thermoanaerobaculia bacterium]|nr:PIN domain-containing protein [Thermoanaerobaculia bacterium]